MPKTISSFPQTIRWYCCVREALITAMRKERVDNVNYFINSKMGAALNVPKALIDEHKQTKKAGDGK